MNQGKRITNTLWKGGEGCGHFKIYLNELVNAYFKEARENIMSFEKPAFERIWIWCDKSKKIAKKNVIYEKST